MRDCSSSMMRSAALTCVGGGRFLGAGVLVPAGGFVVAATAALDATLSGLTRIGALGRLDEGAADVVGVSLGLLDGFSAKESFTGAAPSSR